MEVLLAPGNYTSLIIIAHFAACFSFYSTGMVFQKFQRRPTDRKSFFNQVLTCRPPKGSCAGIWLQKIGKIFFSLPINRWFNMGEYFKLHVKVFIRPCLFLLCSDPQGRGVTIGTYAFEPLGKSSSLSI